MTRINLIDPSLLCDQHLLAEHRELTRIPNTILSGKAKVDLSSIPKSYTLGAGHVKFFYDKLLFLYSRYLTLHGECLSRNFSVIWKYPELSKMPIALINDYTPSDVEIDINVERIITRTPKQPRLRSALIEREHYARQLEMLK